ALEPHERAVDPHAERYRPAARQFALDVIRPVLPDDAEVADTVADGARLGGGIGRPVAVHRSVFADRQRADLALQRQGVADLGAGIAVGRDLRIDEVRAEAVAWHRQVDVAALALEIAPERIAGRPADAHLCAALIARRREVSRKVDARRQEGAKGRGL